MEYAIFGFCLIGATVTGYMLGKARGIDDTIGFFETEGISIVEEDEEENS